MANTFKFKSLETTAFTLRSLSDRTKAVTFSLSSLSSGQTRVITVPDKNITLDDAGDARTPTSHTHAASDVTSGTFDNARINFAAPAAIGNTTPSTGAFTSLSTAPATNTSALTTTGYSLTGSNAQSLVDLAGTWNTTGTPSAFKLNITDTASNASSLLLDLQTGGTSRLSVSKDGTLNVRGGSNSGFGITTSSSFWRLGNQGNAHNFLMFGNNFYYASSSTTDAAFNIGGTGSSGVGTLVMRNTGIIQWQGSSVVTNLQREADGVLGQYNGTNAQEFRLAGTYTSSTNYQRMTIKSVKQTLSALSGESATTTGTFIPDGAVVVGVTTRVATALTGAAGYTIGDGTDADRWGDITGTAIGTTSDNRDWTAGTIECFTAGGNITLTAKTSNFTAGAIEICVFYLAGEAD